MHIIIGNYFHALLHYSSSLSTQINRSAFCQQENNVASKGEIYKMSFDMMYTSYSRTISRSKLTTCIYDSYKCHICIFQGPLQFFKTFKIEISCFIVGHLSYSDYLACILIYYSPGSKLLLFNYYYL